MTMTITQTAIRSRDTRHAACQARGGSWTVTWLPGRALTRSQAITAMLIAEATARGPVDGRAWLHVCAWAAELGLTGHGAIGLAAAPPEDSAAPQGEGIRPWAVPRPR
jgi:hypothetical protein